MPDNPLTSDALVTDAMQTLDAVFVARYAASCNSAINSRTDSSVVWRCP